MRWDARHEDKGKHGIFENLWKGPYKIAAYRGQNAFLLKEMNGDEYPGGTINGRMLKRYYFLIFSAHFITIVHIILLLFYCTCKLTYHLQSGARGEGYNSENEG